MAEARRVKRVCMDADEIERSLTRMAHEILERNKRNIPRFPWAIHRTGC